MPDSPPKLTDFVDIETLQSLQDGFARMTGISTSIRDTQGAPVTRAAEQSEFCSLVQSCPSGDRACRESHVGAARLVQEIDLPCRHECHAGLQQFVAPIVVGDRHLGAIIVGDRPKQSPDAARLEALAREHGLDAERLRDSAAKLRRWSETEMAAATAFVQHLANTIAQLCFQAHELRRRVDELAALHDVASLLAGRSNVQEILDTATHQLVATMGLRAAAIRLLDEDTGVLKMASVANLSKEYLDKGQILAMDSPIDRAALSGTTVHIEDLRTDPRVAHPEKARAEGLVSALVTGLRHGGRSLGVIRAYMGRPHRFTALEASLLEAIASQVASAILTARMRRDVEQAARVDRQIKVAADVQRRMIPARPPEHPCYRFGCVYEPSFDLGGDFYDFIRFDNGDIGVVVADVVGKGIPASLMMASVRAALRSNARRVTDTSDIVQSVNGRLAHDTLPSEFATAFYLELSRDGRSMKYCNAGHEPLLLLRHGEIRELDVGGLALGIDDAAIYESAEIELQADDVLVLFSDGLLEAMNYEGESYGRQRLRQSIRLHGATAPGRPVDLMAKQLLWDMRRFVGLAPLSDDVTIVVIHVERTLTD